MCPAIGQRIVTSSQSSCDHYHWFRQFPAQSLPGAPPLKRKCLFGETFVIGCTWSCQNDNFGWQNDHVSVWWLYINLLRPSDAIYASTAQVIFGSDNGLLPVRRRAIIWTNAASFSIGTWGTNFSQIVFKYFHSRKCISKCLLENVGHLWGWPNSTRHTARVEA